MTLPPRDHLGKFTSRHTYRGYVISRGAYHDTTDDRIDTWYIDAIDTDTLDRRGGNGYWTLAEARAAIDAN